MAWRSWPLPVSSLWHSGHKARWAGHLCWPPSTQPSICHRADCRCSALTGLLCKQKLWEHSHWGQSHSCCSSATFGETHRSFRNLTTLTLGTDTGSRSWLAGTFWFFGDWNRVLEALRTCAANLWETGVVPKLVNRPTALTLSRLSLIWPLEGDAV